MMWPPAHAEDPEGCTVSALKLLTESWGQLEGGKLTDNHYAGPGEHQRKGTSLSWSCWGLGKGAVFKVRVLSVKRKTKEQKGE